MKYILLILFILSLSIEVKAQAPVIDVYYHPGILAAPIDVVEAAVKRARRLMSRMTGVNIRTTFQISPIIYCHGIGEDFYYSDQSYTEFWCFQQRAEIDDLLKNNKLAYFVTQGLVNPDPTKKNLLFGGFGIRACFKNLHPNKSVGGVAVGNFVDIQSDGRSRVTPSMAIIMHEWGHEVFGLVHDRDDEPYLMNSMFNVMRFSETIDPSKWKLSVRSKKQVKNCLKFKEYKNG